MAIFKGKKDKKAKKGVTFDEGANTTVEVPHKDHEHYLVDSKGTAFEKEGRTLTNAGIENKAGENYYGSVDSVREGQAAAKAKAALERAAALEGNTD